MVGSTAELGSLAEFVNGFAFKPDDWSDTGLPIIRIQNLTDVTKPFNRTIRDVPGKYRVRDGDLLVSWSATLGVFVWDRGEDALVNQHIFRVVPDARVVDKSYLRHMLTDALSSMGSHLHGATMQHVNRGAFLTTEIPLPPLPEQRRIASILDAADKVRQLRVGSIALLDSVTSIAIAEAQKTAPNLLPLGECVSIAARLVDPRKSEYRDYPLVAPDNIESGSGRTHSVRTVGDIAPISGKYLFDSGDVLYSKIRPILNKVALATSPGLCSADVYPLRAKEGLIRREYLWAELRTPRFLQFAGTVSNRAQMPKLNREQLFSYEMPIPTLEVQDAFVELALRADEISGRVDRHRNGLDLLFASLQHRAFRGEL